VYHCRPPQVEVRSKVGAGDSFTGAFAFSLARGDAPEQALALGTAAATATITSDGTALCTRAEVMRHRHACRLERLDA
jgi:6-phosphofructokinase 2